MALDTLLRLQAGYNDQTMQGINQLSDTVANTLRDRGQRSFEQDSMKLLGDGNITSEKLQQLQQMYPGIPAQQIMSMAGTVGSQAKAQKMKDMFSMVSSKMKQTGGKIDEKTIAEMFGNVDPTVTAEFMDLLGKNVNIVKSLQGESRVINPGDKMVRRNLSGEVIEEATNPKPAAEVERPYKIGQKISGKEEGGKEWEGWVTGYDANNQPIIGGKKDVTKSDKPESVWIHKGNIKKQVSREVADGLINKGWIEGVPTFAPEKPEGPEKPRRVPYRDTADGSIKYYDVNNPTDRKTLEVYGNQLVPLAENPIENIIRQGVSGASTNPSATAKGKSLDAETAAKYLNKSGGDKEKARKAAKADGYTF